jgi:hypothetical protein
MDLDASPLSDYAPVHAFPTPHSCLSRTPRLSAIARITHAARHHERAVKTIEILAHIGQGIYTIGLTFAACVVLRVAPGVLRVLRDLATAITLAATALRETTPNAETLGRIEGKVDELLRRT